MFPISLASLSAQQKHDYILKNYVFRQSVEEQFHRHKRDIDVIKENHKFLWDSDDLPQTWETRLAKKYYDKLLKEYCIADLSRYKENKIALRWRTEQEVITGKGQFECGSKKCQVKEDLRSWEVNFGYMEHGTKKNALVKLRLCPGHTLQLNHVSKKREVKRQKRKSKEDKNKRKRSKTTADTDMEKETDIGDAKDEILSKSCLEDEEIEKPNEGKGYTTIADEEDVWRKKPEVESETKTRETDFEKYLEDLLL